VRCAEQLMRDLRLNEPELSRHERLLSMEQQARKLMAAHAAMPLEVDPIQWSHLEPAREGALGFKLEDPQARLSTWTRKSLAALPPLLLPGEIFLSGDRSERGLLFLMLLDLSRRASLASEGETVTVASGVEVEPKEIFTLALKVCFALTARNP